MSSETNANDDETEHNGSGIPAVKFVRDVDRFMNQDENKEDAELVLNRFEEQFGKYKFMHMNLLRKKEIVEKQVPEIKESLVMLRILKVKKEKEEVIDTHFKLNDNLYVKAKVPPTEKIGLWLGANVMLEYELLDAEDLLNKNLTAATKAISQIDSDLDFLKEQLTTIEVNMARIYNWNVKQKGKPPL